MSKIKVKVNYAGVGELLKSDWIRDSIRQIADERAAMCGDGYAADTYLHEQRFLSSVYTATEEAAQDNLDNNTLAKVVLG